MKRAAPIALAVLITLAGASGARASGTSPPAASPGQADEASSPRELEAYGDADATCREWSNACQICRRQPAGGWSCSTPGIACVPEAVTCRGR